MNFNTPHMRSFINKQTNTNLTHSKTPGLEQSDPWKCGRAISYARLAQRAQVSRHENRTHSLRDEERSETEIKVRNAKPTATNRQAKCMPEAKCLAPPAKMLQSYQRTEFWILIRKPFALQYATLQECRSPLTVARWPLALRWGVRVRGVQSSSPNA